MLITPSPMNILDYCNDFIAGKIKVDTNYQRTDKVWPDQAKKYLIESIILGYPIPKFFLHQKIDAKSKTALKFVVDGQQRSMAILEFFQNKLPLARKTKIPDLANKTFDTLPEEHQNTFLSYSLPIDLFVTAQREEIIETFRRINSYTVPLNAEEKRHAYHQGDMKWFIHAMATNFSGQLADLGVFTEKNLARMADYKFYAELVCFLKEKKIITTTAKTLDDLYSKNDEAFPEAEEIIDIVVKAMVTVKQWTWLKGSNIVRFHIFQMLLATLMLFEKNTLLPEERIRENLSEMSEALEVGSSTKYATFLSSVSKTTNDGKRRKSISEAFYSALYA